MSGFALPTSPEIRYSPRVLDFLSAVERALRKQLAGKPRRLEHSLSVADTAERLAVMYGADPYEARVAGLLHDWSKALPDDELLRRAERLGVDLGVDLRLVLPLLHGFVAAEELPEAFVGLSDGILHAIRVHTTGCADPSTLDMVLFVADGIEPLRRDVPDIRQVRDMVLSGASLEDAYWRNLSNGISYVVATGRYLWPGTIDIYNALALERANKKEHE